MTASLPQVSLEHHDRLMRHVDAMTAVGDLVGVAPVAELRPRVDEVAEFVNGLLLPHMEAAEHTLYPELERMLQNRHSMTPMRREHDEIRKLVRGAGSSPGAARLRASPYRRDGRACGASSSASTRCSRSTWPRSSCISGSSSTVCPPKRPRSSRRRWTTVASQPSDLDDGSKAAVGSEWRVSASNAGLKRLCSRSRWMRRTGSAQRPG